MSKLGIRELESKRDNLWYIRDRINDIASEMAWLFMRLANDDKPLEDMRPMVKEAYAIRRDLEAYHDSLDEQMDAIRAKRTKAPA